MTIERFCLRLGIPRSTYYYWRSVHLGGREVKRWPAPIVDEIALPAAEQANKFSAWGHRKIWAMLRADGITVSQSSIYRALKRQGLLQPARYHAERSHKHARRPSGILRQCATGSGRPTSREWRSPVARCGGSLRSLIITQRSVLLRRCQRARQLATPSPRYKQQSLEQSR